ncbi:MAG: HupE/UreJ family protein, partial [Cyanobacteria bacterium J06632_22]
MTLPIKSAILLAKIAPFSVASEHRRSSERLATPSRRVKVDQRQVWFAIATLTLITVLALATPAFAHHPLGGTTPESWIAGLFSGLGHPVIGPDHLAFVLIVGLLSVLMARPWQITGAFLLAALGGVGLHLMALDLPAPEFMISLSVLLLGGLVARGRQLSIPLMLWLTAGAGLFHGYAYGEAIVGAEPTPLVGYLLGLTLI